MEKYKTFGIWCSLMRTVNRGIKNVKGKDITRSTQ